MRLLILGGTGEAVALAARTAALPELEVITSLAGRTRKPVRPAGALRVGGFGGSGGLAAYLEAARIDVVIDATHPFAARISRHAAEACACARRPLLALERPAWQPRPGDRWIEVEDLGAAARALGGLAERVFLAIGRQALAPFEGCAACWFLIRMIEPPAEPLLLRRHELVIGRGPFAEAQESALLRMHRIEAVVSKNSGGAASYAKLAAARALGLPVVMVRRPPRLECGRVESVEAALEWLVGTGGR